MSAVLADASEADDSDGKKSHRTLPPLLQDATLSGSSIEEGDAAMKTYAAQNGHAIQVRKHDRDRQTTHWMCRKCDDKTCPKKWITSLTEGEWKIRLTKSRQPKQAVIKPPPNYRVDVIWLGVPDAKSVVNSNSGIPFHCDSLKTPQEDTLIELAKMVSSRDGLGEEFFSEQGDTIWISEPLVLVLWITMHYPNLNLKRTLVWDKVLISKLQQSLIESASSDREILVLVGCTTQVPEKTPSLDDFYRQLALFMAVQPHIHVYPTREEWEWESGKLGDLRLFQEIANSFKAAGKDWLSYFPKTCDGIGRCKLPPPGTGMNVEGGDKMVVKPICSSGGKGVRVVSVTERQGLKCVLSQQRRQNIDPQKHMFHQEYIETLSTLGEFRVVIVRDTSPDAISAGKIVYIVLTRPRNSFREQVTRRFHNGDFFAGIISDKDVQDRKYRELVEYCLKIYQELFKRRHNPGLSSIEMGVRLDVGLSKASAEGCFFVLEATRLFTASTYGEGSCTQACKEWSYAAGFVLGRWIEECVRSRQA